MPAVKRTAAELPNIHPVDELAAIREEIKILQAQADTLRDTIILMSDSDTAATDLKGEQYTAAVVPGVRETLDRKAITEAFGAAAIEPFVKRTNFFTVKLIER